ncbi:RCC1 domain-containing protein [Nannocystis punicea]|uniref:DUF4215 domain-containing protein n=1 Tax=Nannocystis punicea TaxID=2995304 RepID=A0ABY7H0C9_9BACT|nr:DUF4215 domain-containing protein [Nannocystis poenicansa]WAS92706.1 DUF4215 domain-containing protein [Nannocystis poenicansa]
MRQILLYTWFVAAAGLACFYEPTGSDSTASRESETDGSSGPSSPMDPTDPLEPLDPLDPPDPPDMMSGDSPICGNGIVEGTEACDDGDLDDSDSCTNACTLATCGDGLVQSGEGCDDGNLVNDDGCSNACALPACGDDILQAGEICDDGNLAAGDECDAVCLSTEIKSLAVGGEFVCVAFGDGRVRCWGQGEYGVLGQGKTDDLGNGPGELPAADVEVGGKVVQLAAGFNHVCARLDTDALRCWGNNHTGQLGDGYTGKLEDVQLSIHRGDEPGEMPPPDGIADGVVDIAAGHEHTCAIVEGGTVRCWGDGLYGMLGYGDSSEKREVPKVDVPGVTGAKQLALGGEHTCVLRDNGDILCWGHNQSGQLGLGHTDSIGDNPGELPAPVKLGAPARAVTAGAFHTCALMEGDTVRCWGRGTDGQLGTGGMQNVGNTPESLPHDDILTGVDQVVAGSFHTCARLLVGDVLCWGRGAKGALGYGDGESRFAPEMAVPLGVSARLISASGSDGGEEAGANTCAVLTDETLRCWGANKYGQLGQGNDLDIGDDEMPLSIPTVPF